MKVKTVTGSIRIFNDRPIIFVFENIMRKFHGNCVLGFSRRVIFVYRFDVVSNRSNIVGTFCESVINHDSLFVRSNQFSC